MRYVFDLDGTLVDNRKAIEMAYRFAGVTTMRWHRPWREWCTPYQHNVKRQIYPVMLRDYGKRLPLADIAERDLGVILTGASPEAVAQLEQAGLINVGRLIMAGMGMTPWEKADWLALHGWGTYVDDELACRQIIQEHTTWDVISPEEAVLRLFSPPAPTRG